MSLFKKAEKKKAKLRLGISGPSGAGKTYSALRLAKGLGQKIAVIDTEKGSASLYADRFDFDVLELEPPYSPDRYIEAMEAAVAAGYDVIIMDSISHAWAGEGGILNTKEKLDSRGGNSFANWAKMTPIQEKFISKIISCPSHIIVTMRSKQEYLQVDDGGKKKIQKVGLAPIQRDGFEYELTTMFDIAIDHNAEASKDRTGLFIGKIFQVTEDTGKKLKEWLDSGKEILPDQSPAQQAPKDPEEPEVLAGPTIKELAQDLQKKAAILGLETKELVAVAQEFWNLPSTKEWKREHFEHMLKLVGSVKNRDEFSKVYIQVLQEIKSK